LTTYIQQLYDICQEQGVPIKVAEMLATVVNNAMKARYDDGKIDGYEEGKEDTLNKNYMDGYEEGKNQGIAIGTSQVLEDIQNNIEIEEDTRQTILKGFRGGE
jgi:flagellar biosynthesis/type III secretory pathway protein FliH